ncbi:MAG: heme exporter protein CcmB [Proteobacteria bacterium]|nr:heme exporter protein CcmB [Pseudomonadota bacterium]
MSVVATAWRVAAKDLLIEVQTGEILVSASLFALLVGVLSSLAFYVHQGTAAQLAPGVLWLVIAFAGVLAMERSWSREREHSAMLSLWLAPIPRAGIYLGKVLGTLALLAFVEAILVVVIAVLFHLDLLAVLGPLTALLALGTLGFVAAGNLFAALGLRTRTRELALSITVFPLVAPALLCAVVATRELLGGAPLAAIGAWLRILIAFDLVFLTAGLLLFEPLTTD